MTAEGTTIEARLEGLFKDVLEIQGDIRTDELKYNAYPKWNSLAHMSLVAAIETEFDCILETDDILGMSSFDAAVDIVRRHHNGAN